MKKRFRTLVIVLAAVILLGVGFVIVFARGSVRQVGARTCLGCVEWHWNGASSIRARQLSGEYRFTGDDPYMLRFAGGEVQVADRRVEPGCHYGPAERGTHIRFDDARDVRLESPADGSSCEGDGPAATPPAQ